MSNEVLFDEVQGSANKKVSTFFKVIAGIFAITLTLNIVLQNGTASNFTYILSIGSVICILIFTFSSFALQTQIKTDGIYVRYSPFQATYIRYAFENIEDIYIRKFNGLSEYNGWGIKWGVMGKSYSVTANNIGIQLVLKNGDRVLIGTQQPMKIIDVLARLGKHVRTEN